MTDIAIIGIAIQFPHDIHDLGSLWQYLLNQRTETTPSSDKHAYYKVTHPYDFDRDFFKLTENEAKSIDPQQRLFLTQCLRALENAGYSPADISGSTTGVFAGVSNNDYQLTHCGIHANPYAAIGNSNAMMSNRVSYFFNLHGPSITIDTACSSSLYALKLACDSIKLNEARQCLVGTSNLILNHWLTESFAKIGMTSASGQCKTFEESADGYGRSEGTVVIMIKSLANAIEDNDHIYGVVKNITINHGGKAATLTSPAESAQSQLIQAAYKKTNLQTHPITYLELHGTGTQIGDAIELAALTEAMDTLQNKGEIPIGSLKANLGHMEASAGLASVAKMLACFQNKALPAHPPIKKINPYLYLERSPFVILDKTIPKEFNYHDLVGISSFGFGGSNAHVCLSPSDTATKDSGEIHLNFLAISGDNSTALQKHIQLIHDDLLTTSAPLHDYIYSLYRRYHGYQHRAFIVFSDRADLLMKLAILAEAPNISDINHPEILIKLSAKQNHPTKSITQYPVMPKSQLIEIGNLWINQQCTFDFFATLPLQLINTPIMPLQEEALSLSIDSQNQTIATSENTIERQLALNVSELTKTNIDDIHYDVPLIEYGLDSLASIDLLEFIEEQYQVILETAIFINKPSISMLKNIIKDNQ